MLLHDNKENKDRHQRNYRKRHEHRPVNGKFAFGLIDLQNERRLGGRIQEQHRRQKVVPYPHRLKNDACNRDRFKQREDDSPKDSPYAAAVDNSRLGQLPRDRLHITRHQEKHKYRATHIQND
ncbi:hypothetical protein D3C78_1466050 [compost metagenome]